MKFAALIVTVLSLVVGAWGTSYKVIYTFTGGADGGNPIDSGSLFWDSVSGNLYGTTLLGGDCGLGTIWQLSPNGNGGWTQTVLHSFCNGDDGELPNGGFGFLSGYFNFPPMALPGTTFGGGNGCGTYWTLETDLSLQSTALDCAGGSGGLPFSSVDFFGFSTTFAAGAHGRGTLDTGAGSPATGYNFCSLPGCADGANPAGYLTETFNGTLTGYIIKGMTSLGGPSNMGTVFQVDNELANNSFVETVIHSFAGGSNDGAFPFYAGLIQVFASTSNQSSLLGTTPYGGGKGCGGLGCGTLFILTEQPNGTYTFSLGHRFTGGLDGGLPYAGLTGASPFNDVGTLYGTTFEGGDLGLGTVYSYNAASGAFNVIHTFVGLDGRNPVSGLIPDANGNLYGVTYQGGGIFNAGVVYEITP